MFYFWFRLHYCRAGYKTSKPHCHAATAAIATTKNRTNNYTRAERNSSTKGRFIVDVVDGVFDADGDHQVDTFCDRQEAKSFHHTHRTLGNNNSRQILKLISHL